MIEPEVDYKLLEEAAEEAIDHLNDFLDEVWEHGLFIFPRQKPRERLAFYQQNTLPGDIYLVTNPDYMELRQAGQAPPLFAEIMAQQYAAEQQQIMAQQMAFDAEMQKAKPEDVIQTMPPAAPTIQAPPMLWVLLLSIPRIFSLAGSDFRSLLSKQLDKAMEGVV